MEVIELHGRLDDIAPLLSSVEWCELRVLLAVLDPSMNVQMTGSLAVPLIWDIRTSFDVLDGLREPAPDKDEADVSQARAMLLPYVQALLKDFNSRWMTGLAS